jgi:hypothetical protein
MKRLALGWAAFTVLAALALGLARVVQPGRFGLELDVFVLAVGGLALVDAVILIREAYPLEPPVSRLARALERDEPEPRRLPELERIERELTMATATSFDLHTRLRPLAREIAVSRLATRGHRLEESEDELGEELWALVRPDRPVPGDRHGAGISPEELLVVVERLEAL